MRTLSRGLASRFLGSVEWVNVMHYLEDLSIFTSLAEDELECTDGEVIHLQVFFFGDDL